MQLGAKRKGRLPLSEGARLVRPPGAFSPGSSPLPPFNAARYKLQKEKSKASEKKEGRPFHTEIERNITQLYKVETSSPITWVKVDP